MYKPTKFHMTADVEYSWFMNHSVKFKTNESGERFICTCGQTKIAPFCDGTHIEYNKNIAMGGERSLSAESEFSNGPR